MPAKRKTSRRQFLKGESAIEAASELLPGAPSPSQHSTRDQRPAYLMQVGRQAMACEFQVLLNAGEHPGATEAALEALDLVDHLEDQLTWFRDDSELMQINREASARPIAVEARFFQLLQQAVALHDATSGAFDMTAGPLWKLWGFQRRAGKLPDQAAIQLALEQVGTRWITLDPAARTIKFERQGVTINLGAIGKGYALDRCAECLQSLGVESFLMHGGQSSMLGRGSCADAAERSRGWTVALRHPLRHEQWLGEVTLRDRAMGTSGSGNQFFHFGGRRFGHILDPRTGWPAEGLLSATVLAPTAAMADALATAFFVMGPEEAIRFCDTHGDLGVLLVSAGDQRGSIAVVAHGLKDDEWQQLA